MSFCDKLLEKCSEFATATETAIGKMHVLTGNLKKRFTTVSADAEEQKRIKKGGSEKMQQRVPKIHKKTSCLSH